jgi:hypothetical protein
MSISGYLEAQKAHKEVKSIERLNCRIFNLAQEFFGIENVVKTPSQISITLREQDTINREVEIFLDEINPLCESVTGWTRHDTRNPEYNFIYTQWGPIDITVYFSDKVSAACKIVKVGEKTVVEDVYEIQCAE